MKSRTCRFLLVISLLVTATIPALGSAYNAQPKLVVVIVVDQMRADYLERWHSEFGENGFRLLTDRGADFLNCFYNYANTITAPGHATLLTGSYTSGHGILSNEWWDPAKKKMVSAVEDDAVSVVGLTGGGPSASPHNLLTDTLGDELKLATQGRSRVFTTSLKDRAAVFTGGFAANGAYWIDAATGQWITSTFYAPKLPDWVERLNAQKPAEKYWDREWKDDSGTVLRTTTRTPQSKFYEVVGATPFAIEYQLDFARQLITNEKLGNGPTTDLLVVSISSTDILGHRVGPDSPQQRQLILSLDRQLGDFFTFLGRQLGLANVWIALSADHGVFEIPVEAAKLRLPAISRNNGKLRTELNADLSTRLGTKGEYVAQVDWPRVFLTADAFAPLKMDEAAAESAVGEAMLRLGMKAYFTKHQLAHGEAPPGAVGQQYLNSYSPHSGWYVLGVPLPFQVASTQATHGSPYRYDQHVPLLLFGLPFQPGQYRAAAEPVDLAATLASLLGINPPAAAQGRVLTEALAPRSAQPATSTSVRTGAMR
jgi:predicted AlkP superfamily pyrophosphatase or phosphodiesterase